MQSLARAPSGALSARSTTCTRRLRRPVPQTVDMSSRNGRRGSVQVMANSNGGFMTEQQAWEKRAQEAKEAGTTSGGEWRWTLNWDAIEENILVGSCPRSASDIDRLVDEAGIEAILCLQSDDCLDALGIPFQEVRSQAIARGVVHARVAVRDFNHADQAGQLPQAVTCLHTLLLSGKRTYVHCTAGINRATLTAVGYLTFIKSWRLEDALSHVKSRRPVAHPYVDCWKTARKRLLEDRGDELTGISRYMYESRKARGGDGNSGDDWYCAELQLIKETFDRHAESDLTVIRSMIEIERSQKQQQQQQQQAGAQSDAADKLAEAQAQEAVLKLQEKEREQEQAAAAAAEAQEAAAKLQEKEREQEQAAAAAAEARAAAEAEAAQPAAGGEDASLREELASLRASLKEAEERESALKLTITGLKQQAARAAAPGGAGSSLEINPALLRENLRIREEGEHWRREAERLKQSLEAMRLANGLASGARGSSEDAPADGVSVPTGR